MQHRNTVLAGALLALAAAQAHAGPSIIFTEGDFEPGSWSAMTPFWTFSPGAETVNVTSDRFSGGNPVNNFMVSQYMMNIPQGAFNVIHAPIVMNGWTHDPATDGALSSIAASMFTFPVVSAPTDGDYGGPRLYIMQGESIYMSTGNESGGWIGFEFADPAQVRNFSGFTSEDFIEILPEQGLDQDSHPDFAGESMQFAFGLQLTSTNLGGLGTVTRAIGWDDVSLRLQVVPAPGAASLLLCAGLVGMRRRR